MAKKRFYYIFKVGCERCGTYREARSNYPKGSFGGLQCKHCGQMIAPGGGGGWEIIGRVKAKGDIEALDIYSKQKE